MSASIGVHAGSDHHDPASVALQRGGHPGSHQRRLAAARRSDHREHPDRGQPAQAGSRPRRRVRRSHRCHRCRTARRPRYGQAAPGSGSAVAATSDGSWRRIACSNATRSGPGSTPSSRDEHRAGPVQRAQGVTLAAGLILGQRQQRPPALPQRRLGHPRLRLAQHLADGVRPAARRRGGSPRRPGAARRAARPRSDRPPSPPARAAPAPATTPTPHRSR